MATRLLLHIDRVALQQDNLVKVIGQNARRGQAGQTGAKDNSLSAGHATCSAF